MLGCAIVVDDKEKARSWGIEALKQAGFTQVIPCLYGDHAFSTYKTLRNSGQQVDLILTDYHMDPRRKPPEGTLRTNFRDATLLSGSHLTRAIKLHTPQQKICLVSSGLDASIIKEAAESGADLSIYKRRPEDRKFKAYVDVLRSFSQGKIDRSALHDLLPRHLKYTAHNHI